MGFFSKPDVPEVAPPPPAPEIPQRPTSPDAAGRDSADRARKQARQRAAANQQLLTGASGDTSAANTGKTKLGA